MKQCECGNLQPANTYDKYKLETAKIIRSFSSQLESRLNFYNRL